LFEILGFGASCKVYRGKSDVTGQIVAVKVPRAGITNWNFADLSRCEVDAMRVMDHPNVLKLIDYGQAELVERGQSQGIKPFLVL
jgi:serine/threonine protein kinase